LARGSEALFSAGALRLTLENFEMKKSLIALAVLAAAGAASAQSTVTLSGKFGFAYDAGSRTNAANVSTSFSGLGQTDGNVTFAAVEDLGGGMKAGASIDIRARGRNNVAGSVDGRDASVYVNGGFGTITMGAIEAGNGIQPLGSGGAAIQGLDGAAYGVSRAVLDAAGNVDILQYSSPSFAGGFSVAAAVLDTNMGQYGMDQASATADATLLVLGYAAGPVAAKIDFTKYDLNAIVAGATTPDSRTRVSGSYNLGVAKFGIGYQGKKTSTGVTNTQTIFGVSAPVGNFDLGLAYARNTQDLANAVTGYELDVRYNLSKRTTVLMAYQSVSEANTNLSGSNMRVRLMHSF